MKPKYVLQSVLGCNDHAKRRELFLGLMLQRHWLTIILAFMNLGLNALVRKTKPTVLAAKHPVPFSMASVDPGPSLKDGLNRFRMKIGPWLRGLPFHKVLLPPTAKANATGWG